MGEGFLEGLATKNQLMSAKHIRCIKSDKITKTGQLVSILQALTPGGGQNPMAAFAAMQGGQEPQADRYAEAVNKVKQMNTFDQKKHLNKLVDPDYYIRVFQPQHAAVVDHQTVLVNDV